jgi:hypothetical protein
LNAFIVALTAPNSRKIQPTASQPFSSALSTSFRMTRNYL